jgi:hypothetical protein
MNNQLHAPATVYLGDNREIRWDPDTIHMCWQKNHWPSYEPHPDLPSNSHINLVTALSRSFIRSTLFTSSFPYIYFPWHNSPTWAQTAPSLRFLHHIQRRRTIRRTPLDKGSARRRALYLTTQDTHKKHTSICPAGFEPAIPASERPQTYAFDRAATGIDTIIYTHIYIVKNFKCQIVVHCSLFIFTYYAQFSLIFHLHIHVIRINLTINTFE